MFSGIKRWWKSIQTDASYLTINPIYTEKRMQNKFNIDQPVFVLAGQGAIKTTVAGILRGSDGGVVYLLDNVSTAQSPSDDFSESELYETEELFRASFTIKDLVGDISAPVAAPIAAQPAAAAPDNTATVLTAIVNDAQAAMYYQAAVPVDATRPAHP